jgi:hypothetical protein
MTMELNHTIIPARDKVAAASLFARITIDTIANAIADYRTYSNAKSDSLIAGCRAICATDIRLRLIISLALSRQQRH